MTKVFVEQSLASPGSAKYVYIVMHHGFLNPQLIQREKRQEFISLYPFLPVDNIPVKRSLRRQLLEGRRPQQVGRNFKVHLVRVFGIRNSSFHYYPVCRMPRIIIVVVGIHYFFSISVKTTNQTIICFLVAWDLFSHHSCWSLQKTSWNLLLNNSS